MAAEHKLYAAARAYRHVCEVARARGVKRIGLPIFSTIVDGDARRLRLNVVVIGAERLKEALNKLS